MISRSLMYLYYIISIFDRYGLSCDELHHDYSGPFSRYHSPSTKDGTRKSREKATREYVLRPQSSLPSQMVILTVTRNKTQLIDLIVDHLVTQKDGFHGHHKLVITGTVHKHCIK